MIVNNAIALFPSEVNMRRSKQIMYNANDSLSILQSAGLCNKYDLDIVVYSKESKNVTLATWELCEKIFRLQKRLKDDLFCAIYICPPPTLC